MRSLRKFHLCSLLAAWRGRGGAHLAARGTTRCAAASHALPNARIRLIGVGFACLLACLFVCLLVCLFACLFVCLRVCLFVRLLVCLFRLRLGSLGRLAQPSQAWLRDRGTVSTVDKRICVSAYSHVQEGLCRRSGCRCVSVAASDCI